MWNTITLTIIILIQLILIININENRKKFKKQAEKYDDWFREEQKLNEAYHTMSIAFTDNCIDDILSITYLNDEEEENKKVLRVLTKGEEIILTINKEVKDRYTTYYKVKNN